MIAKKIVFIFIFFLCANLIAQQVSLYTGNDWEKFSDVGKLYFIIGIYNGQLASYTAVWNTLNIMRVPL